MRIFIRDLKYQAKKFLIPLSGLSLVYVLMLYLSNLASENMSIIEGFFYYPYFDSGIITDLRGISIPYNWLLLHLIPVIGLFLIFIKDHYENGIYTILKVDKKTKYFFSKLMATVVINIVAISIFAIPFFIYASLKKSDPILLELFIKTMMCLILENILLTIILIIIALITSTMVSISLALINMGFAMATNIPYIIGQSTLAYKQEALGGNMVFSNNLMFLLLALVFTIIVSYIIFYKYNYYGDEK